MEILTGNLEGFYNFATVKLTKINTDVAIKKECREYTWSQLKTFVKNYCQSFMDWLNKELESVDDESDDDQKFLTYADLYSFIFDEDDIAGYLKEGIHEFLLEHK